MNALALDRFTELADAYGGDLQRWPTELRAAAAQLLAQNDEAQAILQAAAALDDALGKPSPASELSAVRARILQAIDTTERLRRERRPPPKRSIWQTLWLELGGMRWVGPALAAGLTLGIGVNQWVDADRAGDVDFFSVALLDDDDEELLP